MAKRLLSQSRLLTLTGVGGVGKSRLALRVAAKLRPVFADGVWLVDLGQLEDPELLTKALADTFRLRQHRMESLLDYLAGKRALLVLDNCEHLIQHCAVLVDRLLSADPGLRILVTSRQPLDVAGEHIFTVPSLSVPVLGDPVVERDLKEYEALCLFMERAVKVAPGFKVDDAGRAAVVRLCQRLDGIPLAIELAAERMGVCTAQEILDRLDNQFGLLAEESRTAIPRHRTLATTMDCSFDLCSAPEQALWARLSVFSGGVDLEAAEEVCSGWGIPREDVLDAIAGLVGKSVLVREPWEGGMWFRLLDTIRQYGRHKLASSGQEQTMRQRHRDWCMGLTAEAATEWTAPREMEWLGRLRRNHENLRTAMRFCLTERDQAPAGVAMSAALANYCVASGCLDEGRRWTGQALELAPQQTANRAKALRAGARYALLQGDDRAALHMLVECRALARRLDDAELVARAEQDFAVAALLRRDFVRAAGLLDEVTAKLALTGDSYSLWLSLYFLAITASFLGDAERAVACGEECVALAEARCAEWSHAQALWVLGAVRWWQGDWRSAEALVLESLGLKRQVNAHWNCVQCLEVLGWTAAAGGRYHRAARLLGAANTLWRVVGASPFSLTYMSASHDRCEAQVSAVLGERAFTAAFRKGAELPREKAIDFALDEKKRRFHRH